MRIYRQPEFPVGNHIYQIKSTDKSIWIASELGITRYSSSEGWTLFDSTNGLVCQDVIFIDPISERSFVYGDKSGGIYYCAISTGDTIKQNKIIETSSLSSPEGLRPVLNCALLSANKARLFIGTSAGLFIGDLQGHISDHLFSRQNRNAITRQPERPQQILQGENYITCIAEDAHGYIFLGHREGGIEVIALNERQRWSPCQIVTVSRKNVPSADGGYTSSILCKHNGAAIAGDYGDGIYDITPANDFRQANIAFTDSPPFPSNWEVTPVQLEKAIRAIKNFKTPSESPISICYLGEDWNTRGDWLGRIGTYWACLSAMTSPSDYIWGSGELPVPYSAFIGNNRGPDDRLRLWVHWLATNNVNSLEMPPTYLDSRVAMGFNSASECRRQSEWDDHGEAYPMDLNGPNVYCNVSIPPGQYILSMYNFNKDGLSGRNKMRDFPVIIWMGEYADINDKIQPKRHVLSLGRFKDFTTGVFQRYLISGPQKITIEVLRNGSFNTILAGLFLDSVSPFPDPYYSTQSTNELVGLKKPDAPNESWKSYQGIQLFCALEKTEMQNPQWWALNSRSTYIKLIKFFSFELEQQLDDAERKADIACLDTCAYRTSNWDISENIRRSHGIIIARDLEKAIKWDRDTPNCSGLGRYFGSHAGPQTA